jgi:hypothetical protein
MYLSLECYTHEPALGRSQRATNSEIRNASGIQPHQQVFQITQRLCLIKRNGTTQRRLDRKAFVFGKRIGNLRGTGAMAKRRSSCLMST